MCEFSIHRSGAWPENSPIRVYINKLNYFVFFVINPFFSLWNIKLIIFIFVSSRMIIPRARASLDYIIFILTFSIMIHNLWFFSLATPGLRLSGIVINWKCDVRLEFVKSPKRFLSESVFPEKLSHENRIDKKSRKEIDCRENFHKKSMSRNHPVNVEKPGAIIIESVRNLIDANPRNEFKNNNCATVTSGLISDNECLRNRGQFDPQQGHF